MDLQMELKTMNNWYSKSTILYEMLYTAMWDREVCFLKPKHHRTQKTQSMFRGFRIFKGDAIQFYLHNVTDFLNKQRVLNTYSSLAKYKTIPDFGNSQDYRNNLIKKWGEIAYKDIISYDCLIDVDVPNHDMMKHGKEATTKVIQLLDAYTIPYYLRFSGMGYHIVIPHQVFKQYNKHFNPHINHEDSIYELYNDFTLKLNENISELIDTGLHDARRITKVPYSLVFYDVGVFVCWAFKTKEEFKDHKHIDYKIWNSYGMFKGFQNCFKRGQTLFNENTFDPDKVTELLKKLKVIKCKKEKH